MEVDDPSHDFPEQVLLLLSGKSEDDFEELVSTDLVSQKAILVHSCVAFCLFSLRNRR